MLQVQESILQRIGKALRVQSNDITDQPVPTRWVDLILHLDEQSERAQSAVDRNLGHANAAPTDESLEGFWMETDARLSASCSVNHSIPIVLESAPVPCRRWRIAKGAS